MVSKSMIIPNDMITHVAKIWEGEYDIPMDIPSGVVLDIGANVGGFAVWVAEHSDYMIHCYEPMPSNYELLEQNTQGYNVKLNNVAITNVHGVDTMYFGKHNCGEASLFKGEEQSDESIHVNTFDAKSLPNADIVKIDTEGAEVMILKNIVFQPLIYVIEYHSEQNRICIHNYLKEHYTLVKANSYRPNYGVLSYVKKEIT